MSFIENLKRRNVLRVAIAYLAGAWLIAQVADTIFPRLGIGEEVIGTIIVALAIGFPIVLVISWFFELTPEGWKLDRDVDHGSVVSARAGKRFDRVIIMVLALAIGYFAVDKFVLDPARDAELQQRAAEQARDSALQAYFGDSAIAVLPFENVGGDREDAYFSDGISEELLILLGRIDRLRVISRSSSFSFRGREVDVATIADELNAHLLLNGSVRRKGEQVRIVAWLTDAQSNTEVWTNTYERELDDVFAVQQEISDAIVREMKQNLGLDIGESQPVNAVTNKAAHDAYLRGRYLVAQDSPNSNRAAVDQFQRAVSLDADYALGLAELAIAMMKVDGTLLQEQEGMTRDVLYAEIKGYVDSAMTLDPELAESHAAMGRLLWNMDRIDDGLEYYREAIRLNPNYSDAYVTMGYLLLRRAHNIDETFAVLKSALEVDPLSRRAHWDFIFLLIQRNRLEAADQQIEDFASIDSKGAMVLRGLRESLGGNTTSFILAYLTAVDNRPDDIILGDHLHYDMRWQLAAIGLHEEALQLAGESDPELVGFVDDAQKGVDLARRMRAEDPRSVGTLSMAIILAHAGINEEARPYLERFWQQIGGEFARDDFYTSYVAEALYTMRRDAGDEEGAQEILDALWRNIMRHREAGIVVTQQPYYSIDYQEGIAAYLSGDRARSLELISKASADGFDIFPVSPFQEARYQRPEFAAVLERQAVRKAREAEKLLKVVCYDNPSPDIWQPTDETCEQYLSSGNAGRQ
jgi:TolB-like protein